ncbi:MAG: alpha/beta hydrolase [Rhodospirillales bacterium]|nr:alpha/beta hydrolase [Rhodospirillales bacterium]
MDFTVQGKKTFAATGGKEFDKSQPVMVLVHGAGMDHTVWYLQNRYFAHHGYSVLAVDLPGHGRSEGPVLPTISDMADWVIAVLDELGVEKAGVAGHSMGALTSLDAAGRYPDRIEKAALLGVAAMMKGNPAMIESAKNNEHLAMDLVTSWGHGRPAHMGDHPQPGLWMIGGGIRLLERSGPGVLHNDLVACDQYEAAVEIGGKVQCPTVLILGTVDMMAPVRAAKPLGEAIDGSKTVVINNCGHSMMTEKPSDVIDALKQVF